MVTLQSLSDRGFFFFLLKKAYVQLWWLFLAAAGLVAYRLWQGLPLGFFGGLSVLALIMPVVLAFWATFMSKARKYDALLEACCWGRWQEALNQVEELRGVVPDFDTIADGSYPVSRSMYFYVKKAHVGVIPGIDEYVATFTDEDAWGPYGYLADKGLIPLPDEDRDAMRTQATGMAQLSM